MLRSKILKKLLELKESFIMSVASLLSEFVAKVSKKQADLVSENADLKNKLAEALATPVASQSEIDAARSEAEAAKKVAAEIQAKYDELIASESQEDLDDETVISEAIAKLDL